MNVAYRKTHASNTGKSVQESWKKLLAAAIVMLSGLAIGGIAQAQPPVGPPSPPLPFIGDLTGTSWSGQEDLFGSWTKLRFDFLQNGKVRMTDSQNSYYGTYSQGTGGQVTIQLPTISTTFSGVATGQSIQGQGSDPNGSPWNFVVYRSN